MTHLTCTVVGFSYYMITLRLMEYGIRTIDLFWPVHNLFWTAWMITVNKLFTILFIRDYVFKFGLISKIKLLPTAI